MRGFASSPSLRVSTWSRAALDVSTTYQPFLLVTSSRLPSRARGPAEKLSGSSLGDVSPSFFGGGGVRLRGCFSSTRWTNTSPFFAYANVRPSSDQRSVRPVRSLASAMVIGSPPAVCTIRSALSVPLMTS